MATSTRLGQTATQVGVKVDVTPEEPVLLLDTVARQRGTRASTHALEREHWRLVLKTGQLAAPDNCAVPENVKRPLVTSLKDVGIDSERLIVTIIHTDNAPTLVGHARIVWAGRTTKAQESRFEKHTVFVIERMRAADLIALTILDPMFLEWTQYLAQFGGNRRVLKEGNWQI